MAIYVNQVGYLPKRKKVAAMTEAGRFQVLSNYEDEIHVMYEGEAELVGVDAASQDTVYAADFSELEKEGTYYIKAESGNMSASFRIGDRIYNGLYHDMVKALHYQRCGVDLKPEHVGFYTHKACHLKEAMLIENPYQSKDVSGGWHDAGDYGRYTTPGCVSVAHLLYGYSLFPERLSCELNIPETGNNVPDLLNECRYELEWLMKMQAGSGGVYHKVTTMRHVSFIMPEEDHDDMYIFPVSSMATGDYAATLALAYRVYEAFDEEFANAMFESALKSFKWLMEHPSYLGFYNPEGCNTGEYDDECDLDERLWAACEMLASLKFQQKRCKDKGIEAPDTEELQKQCQRTIHKIIKEDEITLTDFGWTDVSGFASLCIFANNDCYCDEIVAYAKERVSYEADRLLKVSAKCGYGVAMEPDDYVWGSNMVVANRGILFVLADWIKTSSWGADPDSDSVSPYIDAAFGELHYIMGKNAMGYSYVTGHGENAFCHPHSRVFEADRIDAPAPGWVSGGPFKNPVDAEARAHIPVGTPPMKCYLDHAMAYSLNEITIYWNTATVLMLAALL